uniref:Chemokine-binding protein M3 n=1 Tax=Wood mouse herpesvirus TaxID=432370 RepID=D0PP95_9GAMA|nr:chemokine-binding protein M3 [Wood mouse herpesvirus]
MAFQTPSMLIKCCILLLVGVVAESTSIGLRPALTTYSSGVTTQSVDLSQIKRGAEIQAHCLTPAETEVTECASILKDVLAQNLHELQGLCHVSNKMGAPWVSVEELGQEIIAGHLPFPSVGGTPVNDLVRVLVVAESNTPETTPDEEFYAYVELQTELYTFGLADANVVYASEYMTIWMIDIPKSYVDVGMLTRATFLEQWPGAKVTVMIPYSSTFTWCGEIGAISEESAPQPSLSARSPVCKNSARYSTSKFCEVDGCTAETGMEKMSLLTPFGGPPQQAKMNTCPCYYKYSVSPLPAMDHLILADLAGLDSLTSPVYVMAAYFDSTHENPVRPSSKLYHCALQMTSHDGVWTSTSSEQCPIRLVEGQSRNVLQVLVAPTSMPKLVGVSLMLEGQQYRLEYFGDH